MSGLFFNYTGVLGLRRPRLTAFHCYVSTPMIHLLRKPFFLFLTRKTDLFIFTGGTPYFVETSAVHYG